MNETAMQDMVRGFWDGFEAESVALPDAAHLESAAYQHGWRNGRDDRIGHLRAPAQTLRERADFLLGEAP